MPPISRSRAFQGLVLGFSAALIVSGLVAVILYLHWHTRKGGHARQRLTRTMEVFFEQTQEVVGNKLKAFATNTRAVSIANLLSMPESESLQVSTGAILGGISGSQEQPSEDHCRLRIVSSKERASLSFDFSGTLRNEGQGVERVALTLESAFRDDLRHYAEAAVGKGFDAFLVGDGKGVVFLRMGTPMRIRDLTPYSRVKDGEDQDIQGEKYFAYFRQIPLDRFSPFRWDRKEPVCRQDFSLSALGLVRQDRLKNESLQLPQGPLFGLAFLLLLGLLSFPFLKLFAPRPREHFGRLDGFLLLLSASSLFGLVVAGFLFGVSLRAVRDAEDERLELLAENVQQRFREEMRRIGGQLNQLERLNRREPAALRSRETILESLVTRPESAPGESSPYLPYPHFQRAFFADQRRIQFYIPMEGSPPPAVVDIRKRDYFQFVSSAGNCGEGYKTFFPPQAVEPLHSWATGERVTVFARKAKTWCENEQEAYSVDAIVTPLLSLDNAQVPRGFGFAIVPRHKGEEIPEDLYHSDSWRAGSESFLEETGKDEQIRALLSGDGASDFVEAEYGGRPHRMLVRPFVWNDSPWRLIVFRDQEPRESIRLQAALFSLILFSFYTPVCALLLGVVLWLSPRLRTSFFWPDPERSGLYARLAGTYVFIAMLFLGMAEFWPPQATVLAGLLLPPGVLAGTAVILTAKLRSPRLRKWARQPSGPAWYTAAAIGLLVILGGLPVYSFFKASFGTELRLLEATSVVYPPLKERWKPREDRNRALALEGGLIGKLRDDEQRYSDFSWLSHWTTEGSRISKEFDRLYAWLRPSYNPYTVDTEGVLFAANASTGKPGKLKEDGAIPGAMSPAMDKLPKVEAGLRGLKAPVESWLLFLLALGAVACLTRAAIGRLFVSNLSRQAPSAKDLRGRQILWLGPHGDWVRDLATHEGVVSRSLAALQALTEAELHALGEGQEDERTLLIYDFGTAWADAETSRVRLAVLEELLGDWVGGLWLVSEVAPQEFASPAGPEGGGARATLAERLTENFTPVHARDDRRKIKSLARKEPEEIWRSLPHHERLILIRIAASGYLALGETVRGLVSYGVLSADPAPRISSPELARLALRDSTVEASQAIAASPPGLAVHLRPILAGALIALMAFLTFTQKDSFTALSTAITGIAALLATLSQIGGWLRPSRSTP